MGARPTHRAPSSIGGMLRFNSGYAKFGAAPGKVLLAFLVDGK